MTNKPKIIVTGEDKVSNEIKNLLIQKGFELTTPEDMKKTNSLEENINKLNANKVSIKNTKALLERTEDNKFKANSHSKNAYKKKRN